MRKLLDRFRKLRVSAKDETGGTLAEMALTLPVLIVLLAGVSEIGRYFQAYTTLAKSTRSAARYLSNHQYNNVEIGRAKNLVVCGQLTTCTDAQRLVKGARVENVCIEATKVAGSEQIEFVTVSIPRENSKTCDADDDSSEASIYTDIQSRSTAWRQFYYQLPTSSEHNDALHPLNGGSEA